jgi:hypothetical protein
VWNNAKLYSTVGEGGTAYTLFGIAKRKVIFYLGTLSLNNLSWGNREEILASKWEALVFLDRVRKHTP